MLFRSDAGRKKFVVESHGGGDTWTETEALGKGQAYEEVKRADVWWRPSVPTPVGEPTPSVRETTPETGQTGTDVAETEVVEPPQTPVPAPAVDQPAGGPEQVRGADVLEAGIGWCMTLSREDGFIGSRVRDLPDPSRRVVAAYFDGACPEEGTSVLDTGERVGVVLVPAADCEVLDRKSVV